MIDEALRFDPQELEAVTSNHALELGISPPAWARFLAELEPLKRHNESMYMHSLRVGLYAANLARREGVVDLKYALFAGCGHDVGKCEVTNDLLNSKNLQPDEFEQIKQHAAIGYLRLRDKFLLTSMVAGLHHKFQPSGYGIDLDVEAPPWMTPGLKKLIVETAHLVMICDFFDALTTRSNNKGLIKNPADPVEQTEVMMRFFPQERARVEALVRGKTISSHGIDNVAA